MTSGSRLGHEMSELGLGLTGMQMVIEPGAL